MSTRISQDLVTVRLDQTRDGYAHANEGRGYARPSALRSLLRRIAAR